MNAEAKTSFISLFPLFDMLPEEEKSRLAEMMGVAGIAVADARYMETVAEGKLLVHAFIEQGRVGQREVGVVIANGDQVAAQGGHPG